MANKKPPSLTFSIPEIMDTACDKYGDATEIRFNGHGNSFIENMAGEVEIDFNNLEELHLWVAETRIELDELEEEQRKEALKQQGYIEG